MKQLFLLFLMAMSINVIAQSAYQRTHSNIEESEVLAPLNITSPASAWGGAGVAYEFGESDISNVTTRGTILVQLAEIGNVHLPIMSTVDLNFDSLSYLDELIVGLYPWQRVSESFVAHGGIEFRTDGQLDEKLFGLYAGIEFAHTSSTGLPLTISVAPVFLFGGDDSEVGIDAIIVVPIANGLGLLGSVQGRFNDNPTIFSLGVVANGIL